MPAPAAVAMSTTSHTSEKVADAEHNQQQQQQQHQRKDQHQHQPREQQQPALPYPATKMPRYPSFCIRQGTVNATLDFVKAMGDISFGLVDVFPHDRQLALTEVRGKRG